MVWIIKESENPIVTDYYLKTIGLAFENSGKQVSFVSNKKGHKVNRGDIVVCSTAPLVLKYLFKRVKIVFWAQGVWPEESYLRHSNRLRFCVISYIEKLALKRADFCFFVSQEMLEHYKSKYKLTFNAYYIMPCSNDTFHNEAFSSQDKYQDSIFCYAGGTTIWQCFEETVRIYSQIEKRVPKAKLLLLVKNEDLARSVVAKYNVKNYEIDYVSVNEIPDKLKFVKYGFLLRKSSVINAVATPTKALTYISNGVIPIFSDCLKGLSSILSKTEYKIALEDELNFETLLTRIEELRVDSKDVLKEYKQIYDLYYNQKEHVKKISKQFEQYFD